MPELMELPDKAPTIESLTYLLIGFFGGIGAYQFILKTAKLKVVRKGSYILRSDLVGNLLRTESLQTIGHLVEIGKSIIGQGAQINEQDAEVYMLRVHTFVHHLDLPKVYEVAGDEFSFAEAKVDHIIRDIPNTGGQTAPLIQKVSRIVGVLEGVRGSMASRHN